MSASLDTSALALIPDYNKVLLKGGQVKVMMTGDGYRTLLDIMEKRVANAEAQCLNLLSSDKDLIHTLQIRAKSMRDLFHGFQSDLVTLVEQAELISEEMRVGLTAEGE